MNLDTRIEELEQDLRDAQIAVEAAMLRWSTCKLNTPGRCAAEERAYNAARAAMQRVEKQIRKLGRAGR